MYSENLQEISMPDLDKRLYLSFKLVKLLAALVFIVALCREGHNVQFELDRAVPGFADGLCSICHS